ncbi:hypothetical protein HED49_21110 [Ochrobactrum daejeonense]|nr:hypothetical protein [Brucella daejeonensis]
MEEIIEINRAEVSETGENFAILRPELLESAVARPINHFHYSGDSDILRLAVILMVAIAKTIRSSKGINEPGGRQE